jgi:[acyl-carrier-protein] S-malonyltransferase
LASVNNQPPMKEPLLLSQKRPGNEMSDKAVCRQRAGAVVLLFPGQGCQTADMRERVERFCPELGMAATELVGDDPFMRVSDGTAFAQPAIFCANVAGWYAARDLAGPIVGVVGHSLGEFCALVAAGSLDALDALQLVVLRGRLMQEVEQMAGSGGMAAVSGKHLGGVSELARQCGLVVANDNAPHQVVLSGPDTGLEALLELAPSKGIRAVRLPVKGAFHSSAMKDIVEEFRAAMASIKIRPPRLLALCSTTAAPFADIREDLVGGITRPVLWRQSVERLRRGGFTRFLDIGPGRVLSRLTVATYGDSVEAIAVEDCDTGSDPGHAIHSEADPTRRLTAIELGAADD